MIALRDIEPNEQLLFSYLPKTIFLSLLTNSAVFFLITLVLIVKAGTIVESRLRTKGQYRCLLREILSSWGNFPLSPSVFPSSPPGVRYFLPGSVGLHLFVLTNSLKKI